MPRKKRLTYDDKRKSVIAKLIFITVVLVLVLLANVFMSLRPAKDAQKNTSSGATQSSSEPNVSEERLIQEDELAESAAKTLGAFKQQALDTKNNLEGVSEKAIETGRNQAEKTITDFVYESTLKPIIDKIKDLPEEQQTLIKEAVCR